LSDRAAAYATGTGGIVIYAFTSGSLPGLLSHESGHNLGDQADPFIKFWRIINYGESDKSDLKDFNTKYAMTNSLEDEAESNWYWSNLNSEYLNNSILYALNDKRTKMLARYMIDLENYKESNQETVQTFDYKLERLMDGTLKSSYIPFKTLRILQRTNIGDIRYPVGRITKFADGANLYELTWNLDKGWITGVNVKDLNGQSIDLNAFKAKLVAKVATASKTALSSVASKQNIVHHHGLPSSAIVQGAVSFISSHPKASTDEIYNSLLAFGPVLKTPQVIQYLASIRQALLTNNRTQLDQAADQLTRHLDRQEVDLHPTKS
jgi:hypothetical protein